MSKEKLVCTVRTATKGKVVSKKVLNKVREEVIPMNFQGKDLQVSVVEFA